MLNCQEPSLTHQGIGGAQAKPSNNSSHSRGLDKLKLQNGYIGKGGDMHWEPGRKYNSGNVSQKEVPFMPIETVELVDGLPKWLTDNVPRKILSALVVKSADSYDKLSKVLYQMYFSICMVGHLSLSDYRNVYNLIVTIMREGVSI